ncbi:hypothetical protein HK405_004661 [Cladochytrium tenue]|nr:hypothetical protein HK405_004661 [Cladochytrium tenue]
MVESLVRTFSNLLERLHHSFWFYIMPSVWTYIPIATVLVPSLLATLARRDAADPAAWTVLRSFACGLMGATLLAVSAFNPSLSAFAALPAVPAFLLAAPARGIPAAALRLGLLLLASPVGLLTLASAAGFEADAWALVATAYDAQRRLGSWLFVYVVGLYWPLFLAMQAVVIAQIVLPLNK